MHDRILLGVSIFTALIGLGSIYWISLTHPPPNSSLAIEESATIQFPAEIISVREGPGFATVRARPTGLVTIFIDGNSELEPGTIWVFEGDVLEKNTMRATKLVPADENHGFLQNEEKFID